MKRLPQRVQIEVPSVQDILDEQVVRSQGLSDAHSRYLDEAPSYDPLERDAAGYELLQMFAAWFLSNREALTAVSEILETVIDDLEYPRSGGDF